MSRDDWFPSMEKPGFVREIARGSGNVALFPLLLRGTPRLLCGRSLTGPGAPRTNCAGANETLILVVQTPGNLLRRRHAEAPTGEPRHVGVADRPTSFMPRGTPLQRNPTSILPSAKPYLAAYNQHLVEWTWGKVLDEFLQRGKENTLKRKQRSMRSQPFRFLAEKNWSSRRPTTSVRSSASGGSSANYFLRCLHNLALGMGWLSGPVIPAKLWPAVKFGTKRGITAREHERILALETGSERRS